MQGNMAAGLPEGGNDKNPRLSFGLGVEGKIPNQPRCVLSPRFIGNFCFIALKYDIIRSHD